METSASKLGGSSHKAECKMIYTPWEEDYPEQMQLTGFILQEVRRYLISTDESNFEGSNRATTGTERKKLIMFVVKATRVQHPKGVSLG